MKKRLSVLLPVMLAFVMFLSACSSDNDSSSALNTGENTSAVSEESAIEDHEKEGFVAALFGDASSSGKNITVISEEATMVDLESYANYPEEIFGSHIASAIYEKDGIYYTEDEELSAELGKASIILNGQKKTGNVSFGLHDGISKDSYDLKIAGFNKTDMLQIINQDLYVSEGSVFTKTDFLHTEDDTWTVTHKDYPFVFAVSPDGGNEIFYMPTDDSESIIYESAVVRYIKLDENGECVIYFYADALFNGEPYEIEGLASAVFGDTSVPSSSDISTSEDNAGALEEITAEDLESYANYPEEVCGNHITSAIYKKDEIYYTEDEELSAELGKASIILNGTKKTGNVSFGLHDGISKDSYDLKIAGFNKTDMLEIINHDLYVSEGSVFTKTDFLHTEDDTWTVYHKDYPFVFAVSPDGGNEVFYMPTNDSESIIYENAVVRYIKLDENGECVIYFYADATFNGEPYEIEGLAAAVFEGASDSSSSSLSDDECGLCFGDGKCRSCGGSGSKEAYSPGLGRWAQDCPSCTGGECRECGGTGK